MAQMPKWYQEIGPLLPQRARMALLACEHTKLQLVTEIRMRANRPFMLQLGLEDRFVSAAGALQKTPEDPLIIQPEEIRRSFEAICQHSIYAFENEIRHGFVTLRGGYRVGIAGRVNAQNGQVLSIPHCAGLCIRMMREIQGCADGLMEHIVRENEVFPTLIVSPPMMGKTTVLRDIARQLSNGVFGAQGKRVCIVDERAEIAGAVNGVAQLDVGLRTDVLDACPKAKGMMMALRSLSPEVLITDELGSAEDASAVLEAAFAGVKVIASAHGQDQKDVWNRKGLAVLLEERAFSRILILGGKAGQLLKVLDEQGRTLWIRPAS